MSNFFKIQKDFAVMKVLNRFKTEEKKMNGYKKKHIKLDWKVWVLLFIYMLQLIINFR